MSVFTALSVYMLFSNRGRIKALRYRDDSENIFKRMNRDVQPY
jgi:hypothetical protein